MALDLVGVWVGTLKDVNMPFVRSAFDFEFLFDAIRVLLEGEQMQVLLKTIEFLYTGFDLLLEEQADVLRRVIQPFFFKLLLHWSPNVRRFFHHLLLFRLVRPLCWTRVANQLPTSRVLPAGASSASLAGAPAGRATSPEMASRGEEVRTQSPARAPHGSASAASLTSGDSGILSANAVDSGDVVLWYEGAVDRLRRRDLRGVPRELRVYVVPSIDALDSLCAEHAAVLEAASSGEPLCIPTLHWDTMILLDDEPV